MAAEIKSLPLKYTFTATFKDGSSYMQNSEDGARIGSSGSSFTDLLELEKRGQVIERFKLDGEGHTYSVDLGTGEFQFDGNTLWVTDETERLPVDAELRLVYFRRNTIRRIIGGGQTRVEQARRYYLGWQTTVEGRNIKALLGVD